MRPGLGSNSEVSTMMNREVAAYSDCIGKWGFVNGFPRWHVPGLGPQTDRVSTMKAAFNAQYQRMFVSAGVDGSKYTHPERVGETTVEENLSKQARRKKSRWDWNEIFYGFVDFIFCIVTC